jgi:hypothetical protein
MTVHAKDPKSFKSGDLQICAFDKESNSVACMDFQEFMIRMQAEQDPGT